MNTEDVIGMIIAACAPYALFLMFWPPFDLKLNLNNLGPLTRFLCKHLRILIILSCLASLSIFLTYRFMGDDAALKLFFAFLPFFCLLFIPGAVAFRQSYGLERRD